MKKNKTNRSESIGNIMMALLLVLFWAAIVLTIIKMTTWVIVVIIFYSLVNIVLNYTILKKNLKNIIEGFILTEGILVFFIAIIALIQAVM